MIEIHHLTAGYAAHPVLREVSLILPGGTLLSVIGKNGSGKSTMLKTLVGILAPDSGKILIDGQPAAALSRQDTAQKISYLAQGKSISEMTVEQLVLHGRFPHLSYPRRYRQEDRQMAQKAMEQMGIAEIRHVSLSALSGGMRQKAYIAMALAQDTDYILLDEPTAYLDIANQVELMKTLRGLADSGKGIVTVMHDLPLAFGFSDQIAVMQEGQIAACDTPRSIAETGIVGDVFGVELRYDPAENTYHYRYR